MSHHLSYLLRLAELGGKYLPDSVKRSIYQHSKLSGFIRRSLNRSAPTGLTEVIIKNGILKGIRLKLDLQSEKYYWLGTYEPETIQAVQDFCRPGKVVYDVGANIGYMALVFAKAVGEGGRVYAFEPLPKNITRIRNHIVDNSLDNVIYLVAKAVSDKSGQDTFVVHELDAMGKIAGSKGRNVPVLEQIEVDTICLDDFVYRLNNPPPAIIKIDIEGGGVKAIPGMKQVLKDSQPVIFMELHGPEEARVAWDFFKSCGYKICT